MNRWFLALVISALILGGCEQCGSKSAGPKFSFAEGADRVAELPWREWSPALLAEAESTGRPMLFSINDGLCHWCRVFDRTTLSNERTAELLGEKFLLVRIEAVQQPHLADRFAINYPFVAVLNPKGDQIWHENYLQPTPFNQALYKVLRDETLVEHEAGRARFEPRRGALHPSYPVEYSRTLFHAFDYPNRAYEGKRRRLAVEALRFDLGVTEFELHDTEGRGRFVFHLNSIFKHLRDREEGGFLTGAFNFNWQNVNPVKRAADQAAMAAILVQAANYAPWVAAYEHKPEELLAAASQAVDFLRSELVENGRLYTGTLAEPDYYLENNAGRKLLAAPERDHNPETHEAADAVSGLARAGRGAARPDWVALAQEIYKPLAERRTPGGLFWHLPYSGTAPDMLADAAAMLEAAVELYEATGDEAYLRDARRTADAMQVLRTEAGYYVDTTAAADAVFPPEALPLANVQIARALWRLGAITNNHALRVQAFQTGEQFAASFAAFGDEQGAFAELVWMLVGPAARLELPRAWRSDATVVQEILASPAPRLYLYWTDAPLARLCQGEHCTAEFKDVAATKAGLANYFRKGELPK